ncbi:hypothetical protein PIIN_11665 [Serendipita indica DSM 11827]|uniref:Uncharacterized protein n=1 Tax=Serendipita indica (strain DSM 11827) TaxID=1109443 RepID=G4U294_SERID|nr:hypothetical protein PIIN_11665 [Serendipita indica DSM 11827]
MAIRCRLENIDDSGVLSDLDERRFCGLYTLRVTLENGVAPPDSRFVSSRHACDLTPQLGQLRQVSTSEVGQEAKTYTVSVSIEHGPIASAQGSLLLEVDLSQTNFGFSWRYWDGVWMFCTPKLEKILPSLSVRSPSVDGGGSGGSS